MEDSMNRGTSRCSSLPLIMAAGLALGGAPAHGQSPPAPAARAASATAAAPAPEPAPAAYPDFLPKRPYKRLEDGPVTLNPGDPPNGFAYVDLYDSALAASEVHHVRYIDPHVRFIEVAYFPGVRGKMHGHAYPSVFAIDAPVPRAVNVTLDPGDPIMRRNGPPSGATWPTCNTMAPQAPHAETNLDTWPHHFYRLEFLRVDGNGLAQHWREWYPHLADPVRPVGDPKPGSPAASYDSLLAAPNTHRLLYEDDHVRLVEVSLRPGESEAMHADLFPSVLAFDTPSKAETRSRYLDPASPHNGQDRNDGGAPPGLTFPTCSTVGPEAPHAVTNLGTTPIHFYRVEFKRIDGDDLRTHWAEWYPWMLRYKQAYDAKPYTLNY
jgi:hypothetical protein